LTNHREELEQGDDDRPLTTPGQSAWMGSLWWMALFGIGVFVVSLIILIAIRSGEPGPLVWRLVDVAALALGAAGIFVVVVDSRRVVASWQLDAVKDWGAIYLPLIRHEAEFLAEQTNVDPDEPIRPDHPEPARLTQWRAEAPTVRAWATSLLAELGTAADDDLPELLLQGDLDPPDPQDTLHADQVRSIKWLVGRYARARRLILDLRDRSSQDSGLVRATYALAPYFLVAGIAIALANTFVRPLT